MSTRRQRFSRVLAVCLIAGLRPGWSQESGSARWRMAGAWIAVGPNAPFLTRVGTRHHDVYELAFRAERPLMRRGAVALYHTVDAVPLVASTATPVQYEGASSPGPVAPLALQSVQVPRVATVYGFGFAPAGLELRYAAQRTVRIVAGAAVGTLYFTRPMPDPMAARLNFSIAGDIGVRIAAGRHRAIDVRYRFQHVSNGGLAPVNPGINAHMLRVGLHTF